MAIGNVMLGVSNSFIQQFDFTFESFLKQKGSRLMAATTPCNVTGESLTLRQFHVGAAQWRDDVGGVTKFTNIDYDARVLTPRQFDCPMSMDQFTMIQQGGIDLDRVAEDAANSCGIKIDEIIVAGLGGPSYSKAKGEIPFPDSQTIAYDDNELGEVDYVDEDETWHYRLTSAKTNKAVRMLRQKYNAEPFICTGTEYAMSTFRADKRVANTNFNTQPSFASGIITPYGGIDAFIPCEQMNRGKSINDNSTDVEYAYVYAVNKVYLGCSLPLTLNSAPDPGRNFDQVMQYTGAYDCTRLFEESVVRIEIKIPDNATKAAKKKSSVRTTIVKSEI